MRLKLDLTASMTNIFDLTPPTLVDSLADANEHEVFFPAKKSGVAGSHTSALRLHQVRYDLLVKIHVLSVGTPGGDHADRKNEEKGAYNRQYPRPSRSSSPFSADCAQDVGGDEAHRHE
jgi:hypothetical protein